MKKIILLFFVLCIECTFAQTTIMLADFDDVKVFDKLKVTLIPSEENKAVITGTEQSKVEIVNKNGLLKIRMPFTKILSGEQAELKLYYKKIHTIDANEGSQISSEGVMKQTSLVLASQEGAKINIALDVEKCFAKAFSGGIISARGNAVAQTITVNSGGVFNGKELLTSQTTVSVMAGGSADVNASSIVDAYIKAGGTIFIYGKPKEIKQETLMGGTIIQK